MMKSAQEFRSPQAGLDGCDLASFGARWSESARRKAEGFELQ
jgi:hypothetical protein